MSEDFPRKHPTDTFMYDAGGTEHLIIKPARPHYEAKLPDIEWIEALSGDIPPPMKPDVVEIPGFYVDFRLTGHMHARDLARMATELLLYLYSAGPRGPHGEPSDR